MGATRSPAITGLPEQALQMERPSAEIVWARALEVFGNEEKARHWMQTPLPVLGGCTPEQFSLSQDKERQREILTILGQIDYGIYS
jgi:uncharacterized protein (DUF2384 family)